MKWIAPTSASNALRLPTAPAPDDDLVLLRAAIRVERAMRATSTRDVARCELLLTVLRFLEWDRARHHAPGRREE